MFGFIFGDVKIDSKDVKLILNCLDVWVEMILH